MAFIDPLHPIQSSILEIIGTRRELTVNELHEVLTTEYGISVSIKNLYRTTAQLINEQVLVKTKGILAINLVWLTHLDKFIETAKNNYLEPNYTSLNFPKNEKEVVYFKSDSLRSLDPIWNDILLRLSGITKDKTWYAFNSHPWYSLGMNETEMRLFESLISKKISIHMLYGNNNFLDLYGNSLIKIKGLKSKAVSSPDFPQEGYACWVVEDYLVECIFSDVIANQFAFFFKTIHNIEQFDLDLFANVFKMKAECSISITKNKQKTASKLKKLKSYFT
jgi:hypothetical protein